MKASKILRQIEITSAFPTFLCLYCWLDPAGTFVPFLLSVTAHEAGHLLLLRMLRVPIQKLRLSACGATLQTEPLSYRRELAVAAAGPLVNLLLCLLFLHREPVTALVSGCLCAFNLLPLYPLDGGRMVRATLHMLLPEHSADIIERGIALLCMTGLLAFSCYLTCCLHAGLWPVLVCAVLILKISGTILPEWGFFPRKVVDKTKSPC